ncbi:MAG: YidB family protein [Rhodoplanes sp.]
MGLMDILTGMQNGPRGQRQPAPPGSGGSGGGMSPWMMALLGMLAYKAIKGGGLENMLGGRSGGNVQPGPGAPASGGGLGDILGGMFGGGARPGAGTGGGGMGGGLGGILGGLLAGGASGGLLNSGLKNLVGDLEQNGQGETARSWIGTGENQQISQSDLANAVGLDDIDAVAQQTGMPREQVLSSLSEHLPEFVNQLTPDGRLPTDQEAERWV